MVTRILPNLSLYRPLRGPGRPSEALAGSVRDASEPRARKLRIAGTLTLSLDQADEIWSRTTGQFSEQASLRGQLGIARHVTEATGEDLVITVSSLCKQPGTDLPPTRVLALDADRLCERNAGRWPGSSGELACLLRASPDCVLASLAAHPPQLVRLCGIEAGKRVSIVVGAELLAGRKPAPAMALLANVGQLPDAVREELLLSR